MIKETITRIEMEIKSNLNLSEERKQELLTLVTQLKSEVSSLEQSHGEDARSIAGMAETSVREAVRDQINPELLKHNLDGLRISVRRFEVSHPTLVGVINNIGRTLANIGI